MTPAPDTELASPLPLAEIEAIKDPIARAREAEKSLQHVRRQATRSIQIRDAALHEAKAAKNSQTHIARETGINPHTVKAVLR
jgi:hypothetical protein